MTDELVTYIDAVEMQVLWPDHAVGGSGEELLAPALLNLKLAGTIIKGTDPLCDSYSAFLDNLKRPTGLEKMLRDAGVTRVFSAGLAEDFCVGFTAIDAANLGFESYVVKNGTRPVDMPFPGNTTSLKVIRSGFAKAGVQYVDSSEVTLAT